MRNLRSRRAVSCFFALLLIAAGPSIAPTLDVLTLVSPNEEEDGHFGHSVAGAGDVNGDGIPDVIVGAWQEDPDTSPLHAGRAYVFSGRSGRLLFELASPNEEEGGEFGISVAGAGDVNLDGLNDLVVGALHEESGSSPPSAGRAYVFSGKDGSVLFELSSPNEEGGGAFSFSVAGAGDINLDGFADLIVGASGEGRAYVFSGEDGSVLFELVSPNAGESGFGFFGYSVAGAGDVNQDGFVDLIVGAYREAPDNSPTFAGRAHVFNGRNGSPLFELASPNEEANGSFGDTVAGAGDVNKDGFADVIVGAPNEDPDTSPNSAGRAYLFSGIDGSVLFEFMSPNEEANGSFGTSLAGAGDVNQDGVPDVMVGAYQEDPGNSPEQAGRAYLFNGKDGTLLSELVSPNEESLGSFGLSVSGAGDANQDGALDVIVGASNESPGTSPDFAGRAYVILSPAPIRINSGGSTYADTNGILFVADRAYEPGGFGYIGGQEHTFSRPIGGTDDDPLYQDVRVARKGDGDGIFSYRFDVSEGVYDVMLYLMAPALEGPGDVVMDVQAEGDVVLDDLDVTAEAGGEYQALVKSFTVDVEDGTLDLRFRAVNKAAVVSAVAVAAQAEAHGSAVRVGRQGGER